MTSEPILLEIDDSGIVLLTFNRPQSRNALNLESMQLFAEKVEALHADNNVRAVIVCGAGEKAFCSGGDLMELSQHPDADFARHFITVMGDALLRLERLPVPVIAAINGYALGGGSEIAMACDVRVVDAAARMGFVQVRLELTPGWGAGQRLLRTVGYARAFEILLQGRHFDADEILRLGLASHSAPAGAALQAAYELARGFIKAAPQTVRAIKSLLQAGYNHPYEDALRIERDLFPPLWAARPHLDAVEAALALMNRKPPKD